MLFFFFIRTFTFKPFSCNEGHLQCFHYEQNIPCQSFKLEFMLEHLSAPGRDITQVYYSSAGERSRYLTATQVYFTFLVPAVGLSCGGRVQVESAAHTSSLPTFQSVSPVHFYHIYSITDFQYWSVTASFLFIHHQLLSSTFILSPSSPQTLLPSFRSLVLPSFSNPFFLLSFLPLPFCLPLPSSASPSQPA